MRLFILSVLSILTLATHAQFLEDRAKNYAKENSIDSFIIYTYRCSEELPPFDSCLYEEPHYLIWKQKEKYYLKRFDYCRTFKKIILDSINPLTFYLKNKNTIDKEKIKQPSYQEIRKTKTKTDTLIVFSSVDHSCYLRFFSPLIPKSNCKSADIYDLDLKSFDNGKKNINYDRNQKSKFKKMIDVTVELLKQLEKDEKFQPE